MDLSKTVVETAPLTSILIVDDDSEDVLFIRRAFRKNNVQNPLHTVGSGEEALDFLQQLEQKSGEYPGLLLLDLNMPGVGGIETLQRIKRHEAWRRIPVVVFTTSKAQEDIDTSYGMGANSFVSKPFGLEGLVGVVADICHFWFQVSALPSTTKE